MLHVDHHSAHGPAAKYNPSNPLYNNPRRVTHVAQHGSLTSIGLNIEMIV